MNNLETALLGGTLILLASAGGCAQGNTSPGNGGSSAESTSTTGSGGGTGGMATVTSTGGMATGTGTGGGGGSSNGEICGNGLDDNGNGKSDEGCACMAGTTEPCFPGEPKKAGVGACKLGQQVCEKSTGEIPGSQWGACIGAGASSIEVCNGVDDDCDGQVDPGCACPPGSSLSCYTGPAGTIGVAVCHGGNRTCLPDGSGYSLECFGEVTPIVEICGNGVDDDCDGQVDQGCVQCSTQSVVWDIPAGTVGGPGCITTGGGKCTEVLNCSGGTCLKQPCGVAHCGTLTCNDGSYTKIQYCSVQATCAAGGAMATGFNW
jgi:hypothetical protein